MLYPLCWLAEGWSAWWVGGRWALGLFVTSLLPAGFFALTWGERLGRVRREARGFLQFLLRRDLHACLLERRRVLMAELGELARRVPDAVLAGSTEAGP